MGAVFYVVAILGCGDGDAACADARLLPAHYATAAQCRSALPAALAGNTDIPFPSIGADCRLQDLRVARGETTQRRRG